MLIVKLQDMYALWESRGAQLRAQRVDGHSPQNAVVRVSEADLSENFKQVNSIDENEDRDE